jgi:Transposase C of IS166 homeodomain
LSAKLLVVGVHDFRPRGLPSDPSELRAFAELLRAEAYAKTLHIEKLKAQLTALRRARVGRSSEQLDRDIGQLELLLGEIEEGRADRCRAGVGRRIELDPWRQ